MRRIAAAQSDLHAYPPRVGVVGSARAPGETTRAHVDSYRQHASAGLQLCLQVWTQATATSGRSLVVFKATRTIHIIMNAVDVKVVVLIDAYQRKTGFSPVIEIATPSRPPILLAMIRAHVRLSNSAPA